MLLQLYDLDYTWIIGVGILIGLSLVLSIVSDGKDISFTTIFVYMTIIDAFLVSTSILPLWTIVLFLLVVISLTVLKVKSKRGVG